MDKPVNNQELEVRIARLLADQTAQLLRALDRIERRLDSVEGAVQDDLKGAPLQRHPEHDRILTPEEVAALLDGTSN
jgi:hypothetical protein